MKKWNLFAAIFQIAVGSAAIAAYIVLASSGEPMGRWTVTLLLAVAFVIMGIVNAIQYARSDQQND